MGCGGCIDLSQYTQDQLDYFKREWEAQELARLEREKAAVQSQLGGETE